MQRRGPVSYVLPRPGPALKALLVAIAGLAVVTGVLAGHGAIAQAILAPLVCTRDAVLHGQVWRLVTSGLVPPKDILGVLLELVGLYFLGAALEQAWGSRRFLVFFFSAVAVGNLASIGVSFLAPASPLFGRLEYYGPTAAIFATVVAWATENPDARVQMYFLIPIKGRYLVWITLASCVFFVATGSQQGEGVAALFAGVGFGVLAAGSPSRLRRAYLHAKLFFLRRRSTSVTAAELMSPRPSPAAPRRPRSATSPPLRVLPGGLEDALKKRTPPKDKRYLN